MLATEESPYTPPKSTVENSFEANQPQIKGIHVLLVLSGSLFLLSTLGIAGIFFFRSLLSQITSNKEFIGATGFSALYATFALILGFIPLCIYSYFYTRQLNKGRAGYIKSLALAFLTIAATFFLLSAAAKSPLHYAALFCFAHAAPTALAGHFICKRIFHL